MGQGPQSGNSRVSALSRCFFAALFPSFFPFSFSMNKIGLEDQYIHSFSFLNSRPAASRKSNGFISHFYEDWQGSFNPAEKREVGPMVRPHNVSKKKRIIILTCLLVA